MKRGIIDLQNADTTREICRCNNCFTYYYDDLRDYDDETLALFPDGNCFYKGCPICETDDYLIDINFLSLSCEILYSLKEDPLNIDYIRELIPIYETYINFLSDLG